MRGLFTANKNKNWLDHIENIEKRINSTISNVTKFAPNEVKANVDVSFFNTYYKRILHAVKKRRQTIPIGSTVRVSDRRFNLFAKGPAAWSKEPFLATPTNLQFPLGTMF